MSTVEPSLNSLSVAFVEQMYADYLRATPKASRPIGEIISMNYRMARRQGQRREQWSWREWQRRAVADSFKPSRRFARGLFGRPPP